MMPYNSMLYLKNGGHTPTHDPLSLNPVLSIFFRNTHTHSSGGQIICCACLKRLLRRLGHVLKHSYIINLGDYINGDSLFLRTNVFIAGVY